MGIVGVVLLGVIMLIINLPSLVHLHMDPPKLMHR